MMKEDTAAVVELRRYRLQPGARQALVTLFDREFIETQEACGMRVIGQFRDIDDPQAFVWLRGFTDMPARARALASFYGGPVWAAHRGAANGTMVNSDNVLLLRPALTGSGFASAAARPTAGAARGLAVLTTCHIAPGTDGDFAEFFDREVRPVLQAEGANVVATLATEPSPNSFPRLPVRAGETVLVWLSHFAGFDALAAHEDGLAASSAWQALLPEIARRTWRANEVVRLAPTARSALR